SYWFRHQVTLDIPASDVEAVTGSDPENWLVEKRPATAQDALRQWPHTAPATPRRRRRRGSTKTKADAPIGEPANEE
ncbi:hypothetical protein LCGC14_1922760, partial [marine sediment metagenome]